jgi:hypothetical protein
MIPRFVQLILVASVSLVVGFSALVYAQDMVAMQCLTISDDSMKTVLECTPGYATKKDRIVVYSRNEQRLVLHLDNKLDLENAVWVFDASAYGKANLIIDNIFVERLWRIVKYEDIYIKEYASAPDLAAGLDDYFQLYNYERPHQSLGYCVPADVHFAVKVPFL